MFRPDKQPLAIPTVFHLRAIRSDRQWQRIGESATGQVPQPSLHRTGRGSKTDQQPATIRGFPSRLQLRTLGQMRGFQITGMLRD